VNDGSWPLVRNWGELEVMQRREFSQSLAAARGAVPLVSSGSGGEDLQAKVSRACEVLPTAVSGGQVRAATLHVRLREQRVSACFGQAKTPDAMFLLGSISKPVCMTALMSLFDQQRFALDDLVSKYLPLAAGAGRDSMTMRHLLTHTCGLPDQLPENNRLRAGHAGLEEFVAAALQTPLLFRPGTAYSYSSMGILLASRVAELLSGRAIAELVQQTVFDRLGLQHSVQGLGRFSLADVVPVQIEQAAPEAGGGDPTAKLWDWNSEYWRKLGAPWGGTHMSAADVAEWLSEFMDVRERVLQGATAKLMIQNHNPDGLESRGLGFDVGRSVGSRGCSEQTFGHTGSTGTIAWADPEIRAICVVLTSLPGRAVEPHPRELAGDAVVRGLRLMA